MQQQPVPPVTTPTFNGPQQPQQPPQKPKKPFYKRVWFWIIVAIVVIAVASQLGGNKGGTDTSTSSSPAASQTSSASKSSAATDESTAKVEMQATSTGKGTATWGEAGSTNQEEFNNTWTKTITGEDAKKGYTLTVMGDVMGGNDQKVSCTVLVNGKQKSHKEGSGAAGTAICDTYGLFN
jgi:cytoskeletal protein RodZ